ncbi:MAG TPA: HprK-related kinase A [Aquabacterium sp.]|nr:HprK-related kinase A [Aquabacterium sp.]HQC95690.1 HprK-related kinase A [Aquabacterium sp.]
MTSTPLPTGGPTLTATARDRVVDALRGDGLWLDLGAATWRVQSDSGVFADQLRTVYGGFPFQPSGDWADLHCEIVRPAGLRRWLRPQVIFRCDGQHPFEPFPADSPLPLYEWGGNWLAASRLNHLLLLHAGALERDGLALVLPAMPGSGKSTLTAALSRRGWRLLSDEFGAYDPVQGELRAMLKPVALKNQSIEVIRRFAPEAVMGPAIPRTRKGTVAHLAPDDAAIAARGRGARPGAVILPKWVADAPLQLEPIPGQMLFSAVAFNAFNYRVLGRTGFDAVVQIAQRCPGWRLTYSRLDDAVAALDQLWPEVQAHHRRQEAA